MLTQAIFLFMITIMETEKTKYFLELLEKKVIRKALMVGGINENTIKSWRYSGKIPSKNTAELIAEILEIPLKEIPYWESIRHV